MILVQYYLLCFGKMKHAVSHVDLWSDCVIAPAWVSFLVASLSSAASHTSIWWDTGTKMPQCYCHYFMLEEVLIMRIHEGVVCMSVEASRVQKRVIRTLKLELQMDESPDTWLCLLKTQLRSSASTTLVLNCWAVSTTPNPSVLASCMC